MKKSLTDRAVLALRPRPKHYMVRDPAMSSFYVRVQKTGQKSFVCMTRNPARKLIWITVGACDKLDIEAARKKARTAIERVRAGLPAFEAPASSHSLEGIAEQWLKRHVQAKGLRSEYEIRRLLNAHILP